MIHKASIETYNTLTTAMFSRFHGVYSESDSGLEFPLQNSGAGPDKTLFFMHQSTDVTFFDRQRIMSGHNFVSAVGGGLGLFLGFSFASALFAAIEKAEERLERRRVGAFTKENSSASSINEPATTLNDYGK